MSVLARGYCDVCITDEGVARRVMSLKEKEIKRGGKRMTVKIGINGFGRIGRLVFRGSFERPQY